jgi:hypothetical protein
VIHFRRSFVYKHSICLILCRIAYQFSIIRFPFLYRYKDGEELAASDHVKLTALPDGTVRLYTDSVIPTDCGAYRLVATNKNGEATAICAVAVKRKYLISDSFHMACNSVMEGHC